MLLAISSWVLAVVWVMKQETWGVVMDCVSGDLLTMASMPSFDPNSFSDGIGRIEWKMLSDDDHVPLRNKANDYRIDRQLQKTKSYTGIKGVSEQDAAVQDSQGPIADRTREHLGPTDLGIMHFRKLVMEAARALQQGQPPAQLKHQDRYAVRSGACVTGKAKDLPAVMVERFGDATGYVGRPRTAAAE